MKKRIFSIGLIAALGITSMLALTGCGDKEPYSGYDLSEYVKVGNYKNLEFEKVEASVSQSDVQDEIQKRLKAAKVEKNVEEGVVKDNDKVNIAYEGKIDGKTFSGGSSDSTDLTIGSGQFIPGFEDGLIGKKIGETTTLNLKFPEDYKKEFAGKAVEFKVTVNSKIVEVVPEYNLDFVKKAGFDSLKDYEASVMKDIMEKKQKTADMDVKNALWEKIIDKSEVLKYPEDEQKKLVDSTMEAYKKAAESNDVEWDEYLKAIGYTEEELRADTEKFAKEKIFQEMVLYTIADKEGIKVPDDEYDAYLDELLKKGGYDDESFKSSYGVTIEEWAEQKELRMSMLLDKVLDKVMEYGKEI